eukprot:5442028-Pleurochrysis_carterae.AAC.5
MLRPITPAVTTTSPSGALKGVVRAHTSETKFVSASCRNGILRTYSAYRNVVMSLRKAADTSRSTSELSNTDLIASIHELHDRANPDAGDAHAQPLHQDDEGRLQVVLRGDVAETHGGHRCEGPVDRRNIIRNRLIEREASDLDPRWHAFRRQPAHPEPQAANEVCNDGQYEAESQKAEHERVDTPYFFKALQLGKDSRHA